MRRAIVLAVASDAIGGRCMRDAPYELLVLHHDKRSVKLVQLKGTTSSTGFLRRSIAGTLNLAAGDDLQLQCFYPSGDEYVVTNIAH